MTKTQIRSPIRNAMSSDADLNDLLARAKAAYDALSPEEKWKHRREQAISWVYGQMQLSGTKISRDQVEAIVDDMISKGRLKHMLDGKKPVGKSVWERIMNDEDFL